MMKTLTFLQTLLFLPSISSVRHLSDIHYRFTTCGASGRNGPLYSWCEGEYSNSPIVQHDLLFTFGEERFRGAQGFRVPRTGLYNVTVAGAAGGRGICNIDSGKGLVWKGQLTLSEEHNLLILVGQKGVGPCDIMPDIPVCVYQPNFMNESASCFENEWVDWLNATLPEKNRVFNIQINQLYSGGGGGGGASMIRIQNRTTGVFNNLPLVVAGGGGGSSGNLSYNVVFDTVLNIPPPAELSENVTATEFYNYLINAKRTEHDDILYSSGLYRFSGVRGYIQSSPDTIFRGGAGGGWRTSSSGTNLDGEFLSVERSFAEGGFDCGRQINGVVDPTTDIELAINNLNGGFGGGGGQCAGGGAGGGVGNVHSCRNVLTVC